MLYKVNRGLVIDELNILPLNVLLDIFILLNLENMLIKLLLQLLVCVVDAQLFKGIYVEDFEAKNVEEADESQL